MLGARHMCRLRAPRSLTAAVNTARLHVRCCDAEFVDFRQLAPPEQVLPSRWCWCSFQGATFQFFASAMMWWWALICFNLWRIVRRGAGDKDGPASARVYELAYNLLGWGVPAASALLLLALNGFGTEVVRPCRGVGVRGCVAALGGGQVCRPTRQPRRAWSSSCACACAGRPVLLGHHS